MEARTVTHGRLQRLKSVLLVIVVLALLGLGSGIAMGNGPVPTVEPLGRGQFTDHVSGHLKTQVDGGRTLVTNFKDASDAVFAKITIPAGAEAPLHTHSGPAFILNIGPGTLTSAITEDCVSADYPPGTAFIDPGDGVTHVAVNTSNAAVVLYAIFLAVESAPVIPADSHTDCNL